MKLPKALSLNICCLSMIAFASLSFFGNTVANAANEAVSKVSSTTYFSVTHTDKNSDSTPTDIEVESPTYVIPGDDGGSTSCGNGAPNTGWESYYSNDRTALMQLCSFDDGNHTMVTQVRLYNFYPGDLISTAWTLASYDDGGKDADQLYISGTSSSAFMEVQHTFSSGGTKYVTVEGGFNGYYSHGVWKQYQLLTLR